MTAPRTVPVVAGSGDYPVRVGTGCLTELPELLRERMPAHRYALISDHTVAGIHGEGVMDLLRDAGLRVDPFPFPAGEPHKTRRTWEELTDRLLAAGLGRDGAVIALGGGVTGDLAGFVAATYLRGVPVGQVPTSLVAMIDASVGGKTGVDVPGGKNLVGAFHAPRLVLCDVELTGTLPRNERTQGLAEAVKHGAILDRDYLDGLEAGAEALLEGRHEATAEAVHRSVELKAEVVSQDEREGGLRKILNFGHTLGHALEAASGYALPHGSAVAVGMVAEARLGEALGITEEGTARDLARILRAFELPTSPPPDLPRGKAVELLGADKKARGGHPRFVALRRLGEVDPGGGWVHPLPRGLAEEVLGADNA